MSRGWTEVPAGRAEEAASGIFRMPKYWQFVPSRISKWVVLGRPARKKTPMEDHQIGWIMSKPAVIESFVYRDNQVRWMAIAGSNVHLFTTEKGARLTQLAVCRI